MSVIIQQKLMEHLNYLEESEYFENIHKIFLHIFFIFPCSEGTQDFL